MFGEMLSDSCWRCLEFKFRLYFTLDVHVCIYVSMYVCMYVFIYVCMCVCMVCLIATDTSPYILRCLRE